MLWFLNLFALYREAVTRRIVAEDRAREAAIRADRAENRIETLTADLIAAERRLTDAFALRVTGRHIHEQASGPVFEEKTLQPRKLQANVLRQQARDKFAADVRQIFDADSNPNAESA